MNERQGVILSRLKKTGRIDSPAFQKEFKVTKRTIQNDVTELNNFFGKEYIIFDNGSIVFESKELLLQLDQQLNINSYNYKFNKDERTIAIIFILINGLAKTSEDIAEKLFVSRNTIISDMNNVRDLLERNNITLVSKAGIGFELHGEEETIRGFLLELFYNEVDKHNSILLAIIEEMTMNSLDMDILSRRIIELSIKYDVKMDDSMYRKIINLVALSVSRNINGLVITNVSNKNETYDQSLLQFVDELLESYSIISEAAEKEFINNILSKLISNDSELIKRVPEEEMRISAFVWEVCQQLGIQSELGYSQYKSLYSHIISTIHHIQGEEDTSVNPFLNEIKTLYSEIFETVKDTLYIIEDGYPYKMTESDISYIAIHIAAVAERKTDVPVQLRAIVVCPMGRGVSLLLKSRIQKYFDIIIEDFVPVYKVNDYKNIDLVISTVPIKDTFHPVIVVNQMFLQQDIDALKVCIDRINKSSHERAIIRKIDSYLLAYQEIIEKESSSISKELDSLNKEFEQLVVEEKNEEYFFESITSDRTVLDYTATDWKDALKTAGNLLVNSGHVNDTYVERMIELVIENGPYIVFMPGFVIAHAGPDDGAIKLGLSLIRLKESIQFEENGINVKFIICMSIPDKTSHIFLMFQLYKCLTNNKVFDYLVAAKTIDEIINIIKIYELEDKKGES